MIEQPPHSDHDDDKPVGRLLSRREMLKFLGGGSVALAAGMALPPIISAQRATPTPSALPACVAKPALAEGPFFVDTLLNRFDIRTDADSTVARDGVPLLLTYRVSDVTGGACSPLPAAQVDIWHCDAQGVYSGVRDRFTDTTDELWLRGYQITDEDGLAQFLTIVPGWYPGRAVHIHFKIRVEAANGVSYEYASSCSSTRRSWSQSTLMPPTPVRATRTRPTSATSSTATATACWT
jgi:hypothetical protein